MRFLFTSLAVLGTLAAHAQTPGVGIGTTAPQALLHVAEGSVLFSAPGTAPLTATGTTVGGEGRRLLWLPDKAAFRAGYVSGTQWNYANLGRYSVAAGYDVTASGDYSFAVGLLTSAAGEGSVAMGYNAQASGQYSLALGPVALASNEGSIGIGLAAARGTYAVAIGPRSSATGAYSTAIGKSARTNMKAGAMVLSDGSAVFTSDSVYATATNQMTMRFAGGYRLISSADARNSPTGVQLAAGGGSWTMLSDRRRKENFRPVNAEQVLRQVAALPISEWNYRSQPASQRHVGPMAQDFYQAFHLDGIGADTTINSGDIDGINMVAIQALAARTARLQQENDQLRAQLQQLSQRLTAMEQPAVAEPRRARRGPSRGVATR